MLRETFGERAAALHGIGELIDRVLEDHVALLFCEHVEPAEEAADPASISVASWRVKIISVFALTVFVWKRTMSFLRSAAGADAWTVFVLRRDFFCAAPTPCPSS